MQHVSGLSARVAVSPTRYEWDESSARPLLMIKTSGGVASPLQDLTTLPEFVLYGDGSAYWTRYDAHSETRALWRATLTPAEMQQEIGFVMGHGYGDLYERYEDAGLPDLPTTTFALNLKDGSLNRQVYGLALGLKRGSLPAALGDVHSRYAAFHHPTEAPARIERLFVYARKLDKAEAKRGYKKLGWGVKQVKLADFARESETEYGQLEVSGKNAERVLDRLKKWTLFSTELSVIFFTENKVDYQLGYRPALPHE